jgi:Domain of unknown function (DUF4157)
MRTMAISMALVGKPAVTAPTAPRALLQRCGASPCPPGGCDHEDGVLRRRPATTVSAGPHEAPVSVHEVLRGPGQPLDEGVAASMASSLGHDFSRVRVHADPAAARSAEEVGALAYTVGRDIVFGAGQYRPGSPEGRQLIAHELTHVVQQRQQPQPLGKLEIGSPSDALERQAERTTAGVGGPGPWSPPRAAPIEVASPPGSLVQRQRPKPGKKPPPPATGAKPEVSPPDAGESIQPPRAEPGDFDLAGGISVVVGDINPDSIDWDVASVRICPLFTFSARIVDKREERSRPFLVGFMQNVLCGSFQAEYETALTTNDIPTPMVDFATTGPEGSRVAGTKFPPFYSDEAVAQFDSHSPTEQSATLMDCPGFVIPFCEDGGGLIRVSRAVTLKTWIVAAPANWLENPKSYRALAETNDFRIAFCITFDPWTILSRQRFCSLEEDCGASRCRKGSLLSVSWSGAKSTPTITSKAANMVPLVTTKRPPVIPKRCPGSRSERANHTTNCLGRSRRDAPPKVPAKP